MEPIDGCSVTLCQQGSGSRFVAFLRAAGEGADRGLSVLRERPRYAHVRRLPASGRSSTFLVRYLGLALLPWSRMLNRCAFSDP